MSLRAKLEHLPIPRISRFVAVVAIAIAAGHLVQTLAARKPVMVVQAQVEALPTHIVQLSSGGVTEAVAPMPNPEPHLLAIEQPDRTPRCPVDLQLRLGEVGMIDVALRAPCRGSERIVFRQAGLAITGRFGMDGTAVMTLPAMSADGAVAVLFGDGTRVEEAVAVPDLTDLHRFAVQWQGADAVMLHAFENGADFDQKGDIWHNNPGDASLKSGGFLTVLGDASVENPLLAEIYTYPRDLAQVPQIVVEAAIVPETCGHDLLGEVVVSQAGRVTVTDLTLSMPDCSAVGDFLVLKNLASDMKIASK